MWLLYRAVAIAAGFLLELLIGWPERWKHPIVLVGKLVSGAERALRAIFSKTPRGQRAAGIVMAVVVPLVCLAIVGGLCVLCYWVHPVLGIVLETLLCWTIFATRSLRQAGMLVHDALQNEGLEAGRKAVAMIVGRDTQSLSQAGVIKATVETVAENLSDGVIAPLLFLALGGAPLGYFYKAVNTMDSMVGYKNETYRYYGTGAARLDDACNLIPARLSALAMIALAGPCGLDGRQAWRMFRRDRYHHASPNSAQTESAMAGALHVQLGGDAWYFGTLYHKQTIGDAQREIELEDIPRACRLMQAVSLTLMLLAVAILALCHLL